MSIAVPQTAMVLAAGFGKRLRPFTDSRPKPLTEVQGKALLDHVLDRLAAAGVRRAVVNTHHLGPMIAAHLAGRSQPEIVLSHELEILETGGGVVQALPHLGEAPFLVVNGKILWLDGKEAALERLAEAWDDGAMDGLLLLHPTARSFTYDGRGDFFLDQEGRVRRPEGHEVTPFLFTGIQILHPRLFRDSPDGAFSLNLLYDRAIEAGRLFGVRHDGEWFQVSTPAHLAAVEGYFARGGDLGPMA